MNHIYKNVFRAFVIIMYVCVSIKAQDVEQTIRQVKELRNMPKQILANGIKASGEISNSTTYYEASLLEDRRIPLESYLSGNINFDFFGKVQMPFSFNINSQSLNFTHPFDKNYRFQQPFNGLQFRPMYKGLTLLVGTNSMVFSPYTLNGHRFNGLGIEYKPKREGFFGGFMLGTLLQRVQPQFDSATNKLLINQPSYEQNGFGVDIGFKNKQKSLELILFKASDDVGSLGEKADTIKGLALPVQNVVASIKGSSNLGKKFFVNFEFAVSGLTQLKSKLESGESQSFGSLAGLLMVNGSTIYRNALKTSITYKGKTFNLGVEYNRVDPDYKTLGAYYFTNNLENIKGNFATQLMMGKLSVLGSLGRQSDLANDGKSQSMFQWVGNTSITYKPSETFNTSLVYSNFTSFTNLRPQLEYLTSIVPYNALDTLNYRQISQNLQGSITKIINPQNRDKRRAIMADFLLQKSDDVQGKLSTGSLVSNLNVRYSLSNTIKKEVLGAGFALGRDDYLISKTWLIGPSFTYARGFFKNQLKTQTAMNVLRTLSSTQANSNVFNARMGASYSLEKKHNLNLTFMFMKRDLDESSLGYPNTWQITATLSYAYRFSLMDTSKKKKADDSLNSN